MKKILSVILILSLTVSVLNICCVTDVSADNEASVLSLMGELEIMTGDPDGNLRLDDTVSRAEFTKMVLNASEYKNSVALNQATSTFKDVPYTHWAAPYIRVGVNKSIITGYTDATFRPDDCVLFEEALNICLKLLGYTTEDFGTSWPSGQVGLSNNIGLSDNVSASTGQFISRRDAANIIYNMLNTHVKNTNTYYISKLNYELIDDVILIATSKEDVSVGSDNIYTSSGSFKLGSSFNTDDVGKKGTLIVKSGNEAAGFIPYNQIISQHNLYSILNDDIIVADNGNITTLDVGTDLAVYYKSQKYTLSSIQDAVSTGDIITVYKNERGVYDYAMISSDSLTGPYIVRSDEWLSYIGMDSTASILRNGSKVSVSAIQLNDVIYYSKALNTIWAYNKKITGIYESATPNTDNPTSVTVSGATYSIEGSEAYIALSSTGSYNIGDTVTLLIGRDGNSIAGVLNSSTTDVATVYGYLIETGIKEYSMADGNSYNSYYVKIIDTSGEELEYPVSSDYENCKNSVVTFSLKASGTTVARYTSTASLSGKFDYSSMKIGNTAIASDINIIDVSDSGTYDASSYAKVYPQNMDGITITSKDVLYMSKNSNGEIDNLILRDVTGDAYEYGIVTYANTDYNSSYKYDIGGTVYSLSSSAKYNISTGNAVKVLRNGNSVDSIKALSAINAGVSEITETTLKAGDTVYKLAANVAVYKKSGVNTYMYMPLSDIINNRTDYTISAYYDKAASVGGRIRVIVATEK